MVVTIKDKTFFLEPRLIKYWDRWKHLVMNKDMDYIACVDGAEGSGKSVFTMTQAFYIYPDLTAENLAFNPKQFQESILNATKGSPVIYDEALTGMDARGAMSNINRGLKNMLAEIRQKNLFVFIVLPTIYDLDRNEAYWRTKALFHIYYGKNFERGKFSFYNNNLKNLLLTYGKKDYRYNAGNGVPEPLFRRTFRDFYPIDEADYRKRKLEALNARGGKLGGTIKQEELNVAMLIKLNEDNNNLTHDVKMKILGMKPANYYRKLKLMQESLGKS